MHDATGYLKIVDTHENSSAFEVKALNCSKMQDSSFMYFSHEKMFAQQALNY